MNATARFSSTSQKEDGLTVTEKTVLTICPPGCFKEEAEDDGVSYKSILKLSNGSHFLVWDEVKKEDGVWFYGFHEFTWDSDIQYNTHVGGICFSAVKPGYIEWNSRNWDVTDKDVTMAEENKFRQVIHRVLGG
jgi:hypothetical protein